MLFHSIIIDAIVQEKLDPQIQNINLDHFQKCNDTL